MAEDFTAKFRVDISDLKKNITEANKQIKLANATFKAQTAGMEDWTKDADGLSKKLEQLKTVLSNQKSILSAYREQLSRQEKAYDENGAKVDQLKAKLKELADNGVSKADEEYKKYQTALRNVLKEQQNNATAADDLRLKILSQEAAIGKTEKQLRNYEKAANDLGNESRDAVKDLNSMDDALEKVEDEAGKADGKLSAIGSTLAKGFAAGIAAVTAAVGAGVTALAKSTESAAQYADEINTLSKVTGMSTESLQAYKYAAELVDVSMETLTGSMARNVKSMSNAANGSKKYVKAYEDIGVAVTNADGSLRDSETVFWEAVDALGKIQNETERDAIAMQLFGKSARDLNPLIEAGSGEIAKLTDEAKNMGAVMSQDSLDKLNEFDDSMQRLKGGAAAAKNALGTVLLPVLQELADDGVDLIGKFTNELNAANGDVSKIGEAVGNLTEKVSNKLAESVPMAAEIGMDIVSALGKSFMSSLPSLTKSAASIIGSVGSEMLSATPQIIDIGAEVIENLSDGLQSTVPNLLQKTAEVIPQVGKRLISNAPKLLKSATELFGSLVKAVPTTLKSLIPEIPKLVKDIGGLLKKSTPILFKSSVELFKSLVSGLWEVAGELLRSIPDLIGSLASAIGDSFTGIFRAIDEGFSGVESYATKAEKAIDKINEAHEQRMTELDEEKTAIDKAAESWDEFLKSQQTETDSELFKVGRYQDLLDELDKLIGKNGDVKDSDKARVDFIKNELSEGLGIEREEIDKLMGKQDELKKKIQEVIDKKRAEIILSQKEAAYEEAIKRQADLYSQLSEKQSEAQKAQEALKKADADYVYFTEEATKAYRENRQADYERYTALAAESEALANTKAEEVAAVTAAQSAIESQLDETEYALQDYREAYEQVQQGNYDVLTTYSYKDVQTFKATGDEKKAEQERQLSDEKNHRESLKRVYRDTGKEMLLDQIRQSGERITELEKGLSEYNSKTDEGTSKAVTTWQTKLGEISKSAKENSSNLEEAGRETIAGFLRGLQDVQTNENVSQFFKNIAGRMEEQLRQRLDIHSPSRVFEKIGQQTIAGLSVGLEDGTTGIVNQMSTLAKDMANRARGLASAVRSDGGQLGGQSIVNHGEKTVNFTQINNSPKPLRRWDIYRQTHNGLNLAKEMM